jgi:regulator of replication initiation timing
LTHHTRSILSVHLTFSPQATDRSPAAHLTALTRLLAAPKDAPSDTNFNEINRGIRREVTRLSERWNSLITQSDRWQHRLDDILPKVHTFQKSVEAVMQRLGEAERTQSALSNTAMTAMNNGGTASESEILLFRNQLKACRNFFITQKICDDNKKVLPFHI